MKNILSCAVFAASLVGLLLGAGPASTATWDISGQARAIDTAAVHRVTHDPNSAKLGGYHSYSYGQPPASSPSGNVRDRRRPVPGMGAGLNGQGASFGAAVPASRSGFGQPGFQPAQPFGYPQMQPFGFRPAQPFGYQPFGYRPAQPFGYRPAQPFGFGSYRGF